MVGSLEFFIPYYNSPDYLSECLLSLRAQSAPDFKVTVIDDGSIDNQAELLVDGMKDSRFLYMKNSRNLGLPENFQKCVDMATSDWVVIIGQDDKLPTDYLKSLSPHLDDLSVGFLQPLVEIIDSKGNINRNLVDKVKSSIRDRIVASKKSGRTLGGRAKVGADAIIPWFLFGNPFYFPTIVWNRTVLQDYGFNKNLPITLDYDLIFRILNDGHSVSFLNDTTAMYRRHSESASGKLTAMLERLDEETRVLKSFGMRMEDAPRLDKLIISFRPTIRFHAMVLSLSEIRYGRLFSGIRYLKEFFRI